MGTIARSTKAGSTTSFATSFGLGNTLQVADLDTDLNTAYSEINGSLNASNLASNAITTAKITDLAVTGGKLAVGAASPTSNTGDITTALSLLGPAESAAIASTAVTTRGGKVLLLTSSGLSVHTDIPTANSTVTIRVKRDGSTIHTVVVGIIDSTTGLIPLPLPNLVDTGAASGAHTYTITLQITDGSGTLSVRSEAANAGRLTAVELA